MPETVTTIEIYTDGSCNHEYENGGWAAIIIINDKETLLKGEEFNTTHNRMELLSVIKAIEYIESQKLTHCKINIKSDSQYLVGLIERREKLKASNFLTKKGISIQNPDLVKIITHYIETLNVDFIKVKAHLKKTNIRNVNREVDKISRQIVREYVKNNYSSK